MINHLLIDNICKEFEQKKIHYQREVKLSGLCSFKIGGISPLLIEPENSEQILETIFILQRYSILYKILGGGTNLLISDKPDNFVVIRLGGNYKKFQMMEEGVFTIGSATNTTPTFRKISELGFTGVEFLSTIPGWVGGAVIQNAGCCGGELFDFIDSVTILQNGKVKTLLKPEINYGYRTTQFLQSKDSFILQIQLTLSRGNLDEIEASLKDKRDKRNSSQPENKKSAGSVFKNPTLKDTDDKPIKCWWLIDQVGMRGVSKGGALVANEHSNFIVNTGTATASDVTYLINLIQEKVYDKFNILLEREIEYFGEV
jgi:UDP-N-acetylmuramate dehydrogenase